MATKLARGLRSSFFLQTPNYLKGIFHQKPLKRTTVCLLNTSVQRNNGQSGDILGNFVKSVQDTQETHTSPQPLQNIKKRNVTERHNAESAKEILPILEKFGITEIDALEIVTRIPSRFILRPESVEKLCNYLQNNLGCDLFKALSTSSSLFRFPFSTIESNVQRLKEVGVTDEILRKAIDIRPTLVVRGTTEIAFEVLETLISNELEEGFEELLINILVKRCSPYAKFQIGDDFKALVNLLKEAKVSPCLMMATHPNFFTADKNKLYKAIELHMGRPLLFEVEIIQKILTTQPKVLLDFDKRVYEERLKLLQEISSTPVTMYKLYQKCFALNGYTQCKIVDNIKILQKYGFPNKKIGDMLLSRHFYAIRERHLAEKLDFLLKIDGINMDIIKKNNFALWKPFKMLKNRVAFAMEVKKELLEEADLKNLLLSDEEYFVKEVCGSSAEKFKEITGSMPVKKKVKEADEMNAEQQ